MTNNRLGTRRGARAGVTLIELVVVCVIVTIVTAVSIPTIRRNAPEQAAQPRSVSIAELLTRCRELAIERGVRIRIVVDSVRSMSWVGIPTKDGVAWEGPIALDTAVIWPSDRPVFSCTRTGAIQGPDLVVAGRDDNRRIVLDPIAGRVVAPRP